MFSRDFNYYTYLSFQTIKKRTYASQKCIDCVKDFWLGSNNWKIKMHALETIINRKTVTKMYFNFIKRKLMKFFSLINDFYRIRSHINCENHEISPYLFNTLVLHIVIQC